MPKDMILGRARQPHGGKITYASFHLGFAFSVLARFVLKLDCLRKTWINLRRPMRTWARSGSVHALMDLIT